MKVECEVEQVELTNDSDQEVEGVRVRCTRCDDEAESFGTGPKSVRRCLVLLKENCSIGESNWYHADAAEE